MFLGLGIKSIGTYTHWCFLDGGPSERSNATPFYFFRTNESEHMSATDSANEHQTSNRPASERARLRMFAGLAMFEKSTPHLVPGGFFGSRKNWDPNFCADFPSTPKQNPRSLKETSALIEEGMKRDPIIRLDEPHPGELGVDELADLIGASVRWVRKGCASGKIPARKVGATRGRNGWKYVVRKELADRIRLLYLRRRRMRTNSDRGMVRDGRVYHHDGTVE